MKRSKTAIAAACAVVATMSLVATATPAQAATFAYECDFVLQIGVGSPFAAEGTVNCEPLVSGTPETGLIFADFIIRERDSSDAVECFPTDPFGLAGLAETPSSVQGLDCDWL